jgi:predicted Zn-dependent protease
VFGLTLQMESVLVGGRFSGFDRSRMIQTAVVDIKWVYNSMPPAHGPIYPPAPLEPVADWEDFYADRV